MPRKSKEEIENIENKKVTSTKKKTTTTTKKAATKKATVSAKKTSTKKASTTTKKAASTKKTSTKKTTTTTKKSTNKKTVEKKILPVEYYDLPQKYNQTLVKVLYQTPKTLFIYWEISDDDIEKFKKDYGEDFFETTKPVLIIHNDTLNYSFEVEINDFANSWYLHVNDADCNYQVELGRKFIENSVASAEETASYSANDYLPITSSNDIEMPNNHILFDKLGKSIFFRNTKTNIVTKKDISSISFMQNIGKVYNIYDLYKEIYKDEFAGNNILELDFPSSNSSSNTFKEDTYNG